MGHSHFCEECGDIWIIECTCDEADDMYQSCPDHEIDAEFEADPEFMAMLMAKMMEETEAKKAIRRWICEGWNEGKTEVAYELFHSDFRGRGLGPQLDGITSVVEMVIDVRDAMPDIHFSIEHLIEESNKIVGVFKIEGTPIKDWGPIKAGNYAKYRAVDIWRFEDGLIQERLVAMVSEI